MTMKTRTLIVLSTVLTVSIGACGKETKSTRLTGGEPASAPATGGSSWVDLHRQFVAQGMPDFRKDENPAWAASQLWARLVHPPEHATKIIDNKIEGVLAYNGELKKESFRVVQHESGQVPFNKRSLPGGIVKVHIDTIDRGRGEYGKACVIFMTVRDDEFDVDRLFNVALCNETGTEALREWRSETGFAKDPESPIVTADDPEIGKEATSGSASTAPTGMAAETLQYAPSVSVLTGRLEIRAFRNEANGEEERQLVVALDRPVRVAAGSEIDEPEAEDVDLITIVPRGEFNSIAKAKGTNVVVRGKLFAGFTAHHHTPVLLGDAELVP